ncbi:hypothetical protein R3W88_024766 [Solanum pinnatisectum]|uniref:Polyprotein protein n=1 Tax=Solanum pinnatisectum TaxID=50273 RepID=A0AAV9M259_9SOLN|nr:hypothetical protein R3W88_024766 [Solanum pinnatisectum]
MVHLAQYANLHASRVEVDVPGMIERAIVDVLAPIRAELREHRKLITTRSLALDALMVRIEACEQKLPAISEIHLATTSRYVVVADDDAKFDALETDEKEISTHNAAVYDDMEDLEGAMVQTAMEASLQDTSMVGSSRAKDGDESGTDAQIERVPDMHSSPQS